MKSKRSNGIGVMREFAALILLAACGAPAFAGQPAGKGAPPNPLPKDIVAAWEDAGFDVCWMRTDPAGNVEHVWHSEGRPGDLPAFSYFGWRDGMVTRLPEPAAPFGLYIEGPDGYRPTARHVSDAGLKELARFKNLQALRIIRSFVTKAGAKELATLPNLQTLDLQTSEAGIKELASLKNLRLLNLRGTVTDAALKDLASIKTLQTVAFSARNATKEGLKELADIKTLAISTIEAKDADLRELAGLQNLRTLTLYNADVTEIGMKELAGLKNLQSLDLRIARVTDAGMKWLAKLENLQSLDLESAHGQRA